MAEGKKKFIKTKRKLEGNVNNAKHFYCYIENCDTS